MQSKKVYRSKKKIITKKTVALRKMREILGFDRKIAGALVERNYKQLEKIENGYVEVTDILCEHFYKKYNFSKEEFIKITNGKFDDVIKARNKISVRKVIENNSIRRSYQKIIDKKVKVLISMRKMAGLSQYEASKLCGYSKCAIGHIENGRINLSDERVEHIVNAYGYKLEDYSNNLEGTDLYVDVINACELILRSLELKKLIIVKNLLESFL